jgi:transcriptional regulator with XRE-family HTH domain/tetratricopeptide (TPR) repeat protein
VRTTNETLRELLAEARWTGDALARQVNVLAAEIGLATRLDRRSVSHWLAGRQPRSPLPELIAEALARRLGQPIPVVATGLTSTDSPALDDRKADPLDTLESLCRLAESGRESGQGGVYSLADLAGVHAWPADDLYRPPFREADGTRLEPDHVVAAQQMARVFIGADSVFGGGYARAALARYLAYDIAPRLRAPARRETRRRMLSVATELAYLCGFMCFDDEQNAIAQRYYLVALKLSIENEDPLGYAVTLRAMSVQARTLGHVREALRLAEAAVASIADCDDVPNLRRASLYGPLAVAAAAHGDRDAALAALTCAERLAAGETAEPRERGICHYRAASHAYQEAAVRALLGDRPGAIRVLSESVRRRAADERRSRAITLASLAELHLDQGHLDESIAACHAFIDDYPPLRSSRARTALNHLTARLRPHAANHSARQLLVRAAAVSRPA